MAIIDRGRVGTLPAATERDDETYLDFVTGVRAFMPTLERTLAAEADKAIAEYEARTGHKPEGLREAEEALNHLPTLQSRKRLIRTSQEMFWQTIINTYKKREAELLAELDRADKMGPGSVEYDPNFPVPDLYRREIHIQPGGYTDEPLAGYIYHYGTTCFFQGLNDNDDVHRNSVKRIVEPEGGVRRILDIGSSVGQAATALQERWPNAEVWGTDIGAPMMRYAHKRAVEMGLPVHFAQRLAEDTGFPDNYFDITHAFIVFHEIPLQNHEAVVREMHRVLRPGGIFVIADFGTGTGPRSPLQEISGYIDGKDNCEPYARDFTGSDFHGLLKKVFGEENVDLSQADGRAGAFQLPLRVCTKR